MSTGRHPGVPHKPYDFASLHLGLLFNIRFQEMTVDRFYLFGMLYDQIISEAPVITFSDDYSMGRGYDLAAMRPYEVHPGMELFPVCKGIFSPPEWR